MILSYFQLKERLNYELCDKTKTSVGCIMKHLRVIGRTAEKVEKTLI